MDLGVHLERKDLKDILDQVDFWAYLDHVENQDLVVQRVIVEIMDLQVQKDHLDVLENRALRVLLVLLDHLENMVKRVKLDLLDLMGNLDLMGYKVTEDLLDHQGSRVSQDLLVFLVL